MKNIIISLLCVISAVEGCFAQIIKVDESKANKKVFVQGEPIALEIILSNPSDQDRALCSRGWTLYSVTHKMYTEDLEDISPGPFKYEHYSSHGKRSKWDSKKVGFVTDGCELRYAQVILPKKTNIHFIDLINHFQVDRRWNFGGLVSFPLPIGNYRYTFYLSFDDGTGIEKAIDFSIIDPNPSQKLYLNTISDLYRKEPIGKIFTLFETCDDPVIRDKILTILISGPYHHETKDFWLKNLPLFSNDALLLQQLSSLIHRFNGKGANRIELYRLVLDKLQDKDILLSEAFIAKIKSSNMYQDKVPGYVKIPDHQIEQLTKKYVVDKKKHKDKDKDKDKEKDKDKDKPKDKN